MNVQELFDQSAISYDQDRAKLIPAFAEIYSAAMRIIPFTSDAPLRVLDLGAGTGLFAAMVANAFPAAHIHLTDISEAMLAQARRRFFSNPQVRFSIQEHTRLSATDEYHLIISALSIHHLEDREKRITFRRIFDALRPGGMFINLDQVRGPSPALEQEYQRIWCEEIAANGASTETVIQAMQRMQADKNALLADQLQWLAQVGFVDVDCWYKRFRFAVFGGTRGEALPI